MSVTISWQSIALRIFISLLAGMLLGINRSKHGHEAGLRTTLLVTLAATISMIQMNLLLSTNGRPSDSYASMDMMRLPLGILTGVGFIGAGAIIKKNDTIIGVTTAANLWFSTIIGLCIGGGQILLGTLAAVLGFLILSALHSVEGLLESQLRARLRLTVQRDGISEKELRAMLNAAQIDIRTICVSYLPSQGRRHYECDVRWRTNKNSIQNPPFLDELAQLPHLVEMEWEPSGVLPA